MISVIPKSHGKAWMIVGTEGEGFILQGEVDREQLEELKREVDKALEESSQ